MLIEQGRIAELSGRPWAAIQLRSEIRLEEITLHVGRWAKRSLVDVPFQLLFPVQSRGLAGISIITPYLLARSKNLKDLIGMRSVYGVRGLECDSNGKIIEIDDRFVQSIADKAERISQSWSAGIVRGSFVRILFGMERMLCGTVERVNGSRAAVRISLRSRDVVVKIPVRALLNLGNVPQRERHYFYVPGFLNENRDYRE